MEISGWGRYPRVDCQVSYPRSDDEVRRLVLAGPVIARGKGRSYGDSALNLSSTLDMSRFDRMIAFDGETGLLTVEAGVLLADVIDAFLPRGWFPPVTPGTKFVSVGGMIAADVHGKNHHKHGAFGGFVEWIDVMVADGSVRRCSRKENADLFHFTVGGMGLTGIILRAAFRLMPVESGWVRQNLMPAACLDEAIEIFERTVEWTYSVAWIDCIARGPALGRSLVVLGEHARRNELEPVRWRQPYRTPRKSSRRVPFDLPGFVLNGLSVRAFNALYYANGRRVAGPSIVDWDSYFYPLDAVLEWNRIYGRRGFAQFQCVIPLEAARRGLTELLEAISGAGRGSFLAVLKRMGSQQSRFSFPSEGYTLALDFPVDAGSLALLERLDAIAVSHGGRFYLAKDSRMSSTVLEESDDRVAAFREMRGRTGAGDRFISLQSQRLSL